MNHKKFFSRLITSVLIFSISLFILAGLQPAKAQTSDPVKLYYAKFNWVQNTSNYTASGYIAIENLAYAKNVVVHYTYNDINWYDVNASYVKTAPDGYEVWSFATPAATASGTNLFVRFAINYTTNGTTYWDNNYSNNYYVSNTIPYALAKSALNLDSAYRYDNRGVDTIHGYLVLKNLAYGKVVKVRYTTDNWSTYQEVNANYNFSYNNDIENWYFDIDNLSATAEAKFAISYTVNATTYWDNNFGANYTR